MASTMILPVILSDGTKIEIETSAKDAEQDIAAFDPRPFSEVTKAIKGVAESFMDVFHTIQPDKASVKLGLEVSFESGGLTAIIVKGSAKGNFEVTMEWEKKQ